MPMYLPPRQAPTMVAIWEHIIEFTTELSHHEGDCSICLEQMDNSASARRQARPVRTRCGHMFHDTCLAEWNRQASSCPYCRQELYLVRFYGVPFYRREPIWLDEEVFEQWRESEGGEEQVEGFLVREMGRWNRPAPVVEAPAVPRVEEEVVEEGVEGGEESQEEELEEESVIMTMETWFVSVEAQALAFRI